MDGAPPTVVTLGECLVAFVAEERGPLAEATRFSRHVAGAEANVAVGLTRLGHRTAFIGRIGADPLGVMVERRLRGEGVELSGLTVDPDGPTGVIVRERRQVGPSEVVYHRVGSAGSKLARPDVEAATETIRAARWVHVTGITPALSVTAADALDAAVEIACAADVPISLDLNIRRKLWSVDEARVILDLLIPQVDVVFANLNEAVVVAGTDGEPGDASSLARTLVRLGARTAVLKLPGGEALLASSAGEIRVSPPVVVTDVVDAVGAGDAFAAGFIAARLEARDDEEALRLGHACAAAVMSAVGDMTALPTRTEAEVLLARRGERSIR